MQENAELFDGVEGDWTVEAAAVDDEGVARDAVDDEGVARDDDDDEGVARDADDDGEEKISGDVDEAAGNGVDIDTETVTPMTAVEDETPLMQQNGDDGAETAIATEAAENSDARTERKRRRKPKWERDVQPAESAIVADVNGNDLACEKCGAEFLSRNKLFQHVKAVGHGTVKTNQKLTNQKSNKANKGNK